MKGIGSLELGHDQYRGFRVLGAVYVFHLFVECMSKEFSLSLIAEIVIQSPPLLLEASFQSPNVGMGHRNSEHSYKTSAILRRHIAAVGYT